MNQKMYVITIKTGFDHDYTENVDCVTDNLEKAKEYVSNKNNFCKKLKEKIKNFNNTSFLEWSKENPSPFETLKGQINSNKRADFSQKNQKWLKERNEYINKWYKENLTEEEFNFYKNCETDIDSIWSFQEVKMM